MVGDTSSPGAADTGPFFFANLAFISKIDKLTVKNFDPKIVTLFYLWLERVRLLVLGTS